MSSIGEAQHDLATGQPKTVYLDQFAWIQLARARLGRETEEAHVRARSRLAEAVMSESLICPLSLVHYLETWKQANEQRRGEVAVEMSLLSRFRTIAPMRTLLRTEIENALLEIFGRLKATTQVRPFGTGFVHAVDAPPELRPQVSGLTNEQVFLAEWAILSGHGKDRYLEQERQRRFDAEHFAKTETERSRALSGWRAGSRERTQRFRVSALSEFERELIPALFAADVSLAELESLGSDGLEELVSAIPTLWVLTELRRVRYPDAAQGFRPTDLNDLRALAAAVAYCDVVVADKAWVDMLRRTDLPQTYGTAVYSNIVDGAASATGTTPPTGSILDG